MINARVEKKDGKYFLNGKELSFANSSKPSASEAEQLSLIILETLTSKNYAMKNYQKFKHDFVLDFLDACLNKKKNHSMPVLTFSLKWREAERKKEAEQKIKYNA